MIENDQEKSQERSLYKELLKDKKKMSIFMALIVLILSFIIYFAKGYFFGIKVENDSMLENIPMVEVVKIKLTDINKTLKFVGNLKPNEQVILKSEVDAVIKGIHFFEGQMVNSGDLLISFDDAAARAQYEEVVAKYLNAKAEYEMTLKLAKNKYISESELNKKEAEMKAFFAQTKQVKNTLEKHKVFAPFEGRVGLKEISVGEYMTRGREMLTLVDETPMKVDFKVPEMQIHRIRVGQFLTINVDGVENDFSATIRAIDPIGDKASHSFVVRGILDEEISSESYGIYPGQFVRLRLLNDVQQKAIMVPQGALVRSGDTESVYRIIDGSAIQTEVIVGDIYDGMVEIIGGINEGDVVIVNGQERIRDGMKVKSVSENDLNENALNDKISSDNALSKYSSENKTNEENKDEKVASSESDSKKPSEKSGEKIQDTTKEVKSDNDTTKNVEEKKIVEEKDSTNKSDDAKEVDKNVVEKTTPTKSDSEVNAVNKEKVSKQNNENKEFDEKSLTKKTKN